MDGLNFINSSNDSNNSSIIIFQSSVSLPGDFAPAWQIISLSSGESKSVPVPSGGKFHISIIKPEVVVNDGVLTIKEFSSPAVAISAGQTGIVNGDTITVKD
jgi:hypothetical protein